MLLVHQPSINYHKEDFTWPFPQMVIHFRHQKLEHEPRAAYFYQMPLTHTTNSQLIGIVRNTIMRLMTLCNYEGSPMTPPHCDIKSHTFMLNFIQIAYPADSM